MTDLASFPTEAGTAFSLLRRANVLKGEKVLITGASGVVGGYAVQIAHALGAIPIAVCASSTRDRVMRMGARYTVSIDCIKAASCGADAVVPALAALDIGKMDVVADVVGDTTAYLKCLRRGGRYVVSGAIGGHVVQLDLRELSLRDLTMLGAAVTAPSVFAELMRMIENGRIQPNVSHVMPLHQVKAAHEMLTSKNFVGKIVLDVKASAVAAAEARAAAAAETKAATTLAASAPLLPCGIVRTLTATNDFTAFSNDKSSFVPIPSHYFGTLPVTFAEVPGVATDYTSVQLSLSSGEEEDGKVTVAAVGLRESIFETVALRQGPCSHLGDAYKQHIVPCIPAADVTVRAAPSFHITPSLSGAVTKCLIKVPPLEQGPRQGPDLPQKLHTGFASGVRSAMLFNRDTAQWYRLKGCGNNADGFLVSPVETGSTHVTIRGSSFEHTTHRELLYSQIIGRLLQKRGYVGCNEPAGWYDYRVPNDPYPLIKKTCAVYTTRGNIRLGDHLLNGLEQLLPHLVTHNAARAVKDNFPDTRKDVPQSWNLVFERSTDWRNFVPVSFGESLPLQSSQHQLQQQNLKQEAVSVSITAEDGNEDGDEDEDVPPMPATALPQLSNLWREKYARLRHLLSSKASVKNTMRKHGIGSLCAYIYHRLGRDCGAILNVLHANQILWGTYEDAMGTHCNAHVNNFVVLPQADGGRQKKGVFLAPLDFDMAFSRTDFIYLKERRRFGYDEEKKEPKQQQQKRDLAEKRSAAFAELMQKETDGLVLVLGGASFVNTGAAAEATVPEEYAHVKWACRDTLMKAFHQAYHEGTDASSGSAQSTSSSSVSQRDPHPHVPELDEVVYCLFDLAIILSSKERA